MTEKIGRQCRIAPCDSRALNAKSWNEKSKMYAIKINVGDFHEYRLVGQKSAVEKTKKWISKCKFKVPLAMIVFSAIQVRLKSLISAANKIVFSDFLPLGWLNQFDISNTRLLTRPYLWVMAFPDLFTTSCRLCSSFNQCNSATCHRMSTWNRAQSFTSCACLHWWSVGRIFCRECLTRLIVDGWRKLRSLRLADKSHFSHFSGEFWRDLFGANFNEIFSEFLNNFASFLSNHFCELSRG